MEMVGSLIIVFIIMAILIGALADFIKRLFKQGGATDRNASMICPNCGTRGTPKSVTGGSMGIEIVLWLCFIVPGLIYSLWRLSSKKDGCPACGMPNMIGVETPNGRMLVEKFHQNQP
ncbi:MAG TPA: hypothetical protein DCK83_00575 [Gallionellaceae bacterium]|nr:hypothetical protein [Gallionellaceae bacterium]